MSYDLYFYKRKTDHITGAEIANYLTANLVPANERGNQWFFENEDTGVYFSFETNEPSNDADDIELFESFPDFDNTRFSFNLNFVRPSFFGLEAFQFVDKFINDLGLLVLNPQRDIDCPYMPSKEDLFENWNSTNLAVLRERLDERACYCPPAKSNDVWEFNFNRQKLQADFGNGYFVAKIFFCKTLYDNNAVTLCMWTEHIPVVLPKTDYYLLGRKYTRFFKEVNDKILIPRKTFMENFGNYFEDYPFKECKMIRPANATKVAGVFNKLTSDIVFEKHLKGISVDFVYNAKP